MRRSVALPNKSPNTTNGGTPAPPTASPAITPSLPAGTLSQAQSSQAASSAPPAITSSAKTAPGIDDNSTSSTPAPANPSVDPPPKPQPKPRPINESASAPQVPAAPLLPGQFVAKTAYEHQRNANIAKNYELMKSLGLEGGAKAKVFAPMERKKRGKAAKDKKEPSEPSRRSGRIRDG